MEAVAAIALFCNVLDLGEKTVKSIKKAKEVYDSASGLSDGHKHLSDLADEALDLFKQIEDSQKRLRDPTLASMGQVCAVEDISARCNEISLEMKTILDTCRAGQQGSLKESTKATLRSIMKKSQLDEHQSRLEQSLSLLQTALAASTRNLLGQVLDTLTQVSASNYDLQGQLRNLRAELNSLHDTTRLLRKAGELSERSRESLCLSYVIYGLGEETGLGALNYRYEEVHDAAEGTFTWILEEPQRLLEIIPHPSMTLSQWLREGDGIFHVTGKPGSGKSTLLKMVAQHPETKRLLNAWASGKKLLLLKFFFWKFSEAQNGLQGMRRCLLRTAVQQAPELCTVLFAHCLQNISSTSNPTRFTEYEVAKAFDILIRDVKALQDYRTFILIDGLDEFDEQQHAEDHNDLAQMIQDWISISHGTIKLCVSSREYDAFSVFPADLRIRLQDITRKDMEVFVKERLTSHPRFRKVLVIPPSVGNGYGCSACGDCAMGHDCLVRSIISRAEGVFLWIALVSKDIRKALSNGCSLRQLRSRIEHVPKGLEKSIIYMTESVEPQHQQGVYLLLALLVERDKYKVSKRQAEIERVYDMTILRAVSFLFDKQDFHCLDEELEKEPTGDITSSHLEPSLDREQAISRCNGLVDVVLDHRRDMVLSCTHRSVIETLHHILTSKLASHGLTNLDIGEWACRMTLVNLFHTWCKLESLFQTRNSDTSTDPNFCDDPDVLDVRADMDLQLGVLFRVLVQMCILTEPSIMHLLGLIENMCLKTFFGTDSPNDSDWKQLAEEAMLAPLSTVHPCSVLIHAAYWGPREYVNLQLRRIDMASQGYLKCLLLSSMCAGMDRITNTRDDVYQITSQLLCSSLTSDNTLSQRRYMFPWEPESDLMHFAPALWHHCLCNLISWVGEVADLSL
ncbi:hypothetical protein F4778DRAFT_167571 [Xylariomycetidae sp. FL2044]|nr:hypothetical protein F4778DRAFT_167571 [Xylariomycetidae sp. FL2044]